MFGEGVPEGGGSSREGSVPPCSVLSLGDGEKKCIRGAEGTWRDVWVEKVREVGGGLVMECFMGEEEDLEFYPLLDKEPVETGVMWSRERV